jgi:uroporphyrinogen-III synthase
METGTGAEPLIGFTIGITAARRRDELLALLQALGAKVVDAPTVRVVAPADDPVLRRATDRVLERRPDYVVATTGVGWRGWLTAAEGWGRADRVIAACRAGVLICWGPKAVGAVRAYGLREVYSPGSDAGDEVLAWLLARDLRGRRIVVQEHGAPSDGFADALRARGADVTQIPVYRWGPPEDPGAVRRLVEQTARREIHALTFTSAPAIGAFLETADAQGRRADVLAALRADVLPVCIGPVCARPLAEQGIESVWPDRGRLGSLVRTIAEALPARARRELDTGTERMILQGNALLVDGRTIWLPPVPGAVLRALAEKPGWVLSRAELLHRVWADTRTDEHAVEAAVARLRTALGPYAGLVRTVTKRGYRLAVDP